MSHKHRVSASMTTLTVNRRCFLGIFLILSNFQITALASLGESTLKAVEGIVLSGRTTRKEFACTSFQQ